MNDCGMKKENRARRGVRISGGGKIGMQEQKGDICMHMYLIGVPKQRILLADPH
jgi:hypothetical protein